MKTIKWALPLIIIAFTACSTSKKTAKIKANSGNIACAEITPAEGLHLDWVKEADTVLRGYKETRLPDKYELYSIDPVQVDSFVNASKTISTLRSIVPLPDPIGCKVYNFSPFETMNPQLKAKYPDLITFKGSDQNSGQSNLSISFNKGVIHGDVNWDNKSYLINTIKYRNRLFYIVYSSTTDILKQFTPSNKKSLQPQYDK